MAEGLTDHIWTIKEILKLGRQFNDSRPRPIPIVRHLSFAVSEDDFAETNKGELIIKAGRYSGRYQILLYTPTNLDATVQSV